MIPRFKIGDRVWLATYGTVDARVTCPICFGTLAVTLVLGNGEEVRLPCGYCGHGFDGPRGYVVEHRAEALAESVTIDSVTVSATGIEYGAPCRTLRDERTFATEAEALAAAVAVAAEEERAREARANYAKASDKRSYAWNAGYHRRAAEHLRERATYHERMAAICKSKSAAEKAAPTPSTT
jgi:hypothetical protein